MTIEPQQHGAMAGGKLPSDSCSAIEQKEVEELYPEI